MTVHPDRRQFVATSTAAMLVACAAPLVRKRAASDLIIRGGTVFDGSGAAGVELDVAMTAGRITAIGRNLAERGTEEIDARGLAVAPGFIDIHSHGDGNLEADPRQETLIRQGLTTIVVGQDGSSRAPRARARTSGAEPGEETAQSFGAAMDAINKAQPSVNIASMIGLGSLRAAVVGEDDRPATPAEMERMVAMVQQALAQGACGASSGLGLAIARELAAEGANVRFSPE